MAQHTQPLGSHSSHNSAQVQQLTQTPTSSHSNNSNLIQQNTVTLTSNSNNNNHSLSSSHCNPSGGPSNNTNQHQQLQNNVNNNHLNTNNTVIVPVSQAIYPAGTTAAVVNTSQQIHYPGPTSIYMPQTTGAVHAPHPHTSLFPLIQAPMPNSVYGNNIAAVPATSGWAPVVPSYIPTGTFNEVHTDSKNKYILQNGFQLQQLSLPIIQNTNVQPPQNMNMRGGGGMRRKSRVGPSRYNRGHHHHHHMQQQQQQHVINADGSQVQDNLQGGAPQAIDATGAPLIAGTTATSGPYQTHPHYAPSPTSYQYAAYQTYFAPQNPMIHTPHPATVPGQPGAAAGTPVYVSSVPIFNTQFYNYGYIYPTEYQYVQNGDEMTADGRQNADAAMLQPMWHQGIYTDEYGVPTDMNAIPVGDEYNQASSLGSADTMSPNYAVYDTQIPDLTQQMDAMQMYDESQAIDDNAATAAVIHSQHVLQGVAPNATVSGASLMPQMNDNLGECGDGHMSQMKLSNENVVMTAQQTQQPEYIIEATQEEPPITHHRPMNPRPALLPTPLGTELVPLSTIEQLQAQQQQAYQEAIEHSEQNLCHGNERHYNAGHEYDLNMASNHSIHLVGGNAVTQVPHNDVVEPHMVMVSTSQQCNISINNNNNNDVPKTIQSNEDVSITKHHQQHHQQQHHHQQHQHQHHQQQQPQHQYQQKQKSNYQQKNQDGSNSDQYKKDNQLINKSSGPITTTPIVTANVAPTVASPPSPKPQRQQPKQQNINQEQQQQQQLQQQPNEQRKSISSSQVSNQQQPQQIQQQQNQQQQQQNQQQQQQNQQQQQQNQQQQQQNQQQQQQNQQQQQQNQQQQQQSRRKHSNSDQNTGNDKYMQTTKTMSWTNSSQHKKSTASVAVTAAPQNQSHGRNKHNNSTRTSNQSQNRNHGIANKQAINSTITQNPPATGTIERKHSHGGLDSATNKNKYKQNSTSTTNVTVGNSSSGTNIMTTTNSSNQNIGGGQQQASKMNLPLNNVNNMIHATTSPTSIASLNVATNQYPNQGIHPQSPVEHMQTKTNDISNVDQSLPITAANQPSAAPVQTNAIQTQTSNTNFGKQYSGFDQKKPSVPRTTSPITSKVPTSNTATMTVETASDYVTHTASVGTSTTPSLTHLTKAQMTDVSSFANFDNSNGPLNGSLNVVTNVSTNAQTNVPANIPVNVAANVPDNVPANVSATVAANTSGNLPVNVSASLSANVSANMATNVGTNVSANVVTSVATNGSTNAPAIVATNASGNAPVNGSTNVVATTSTLTTNEKAETSPAFNLAPPPPVATPAPPASNTTTSWASLFSAANNTTKTSTITSATANNRPTTSSLPLNSSKKQSHSQGQHSTPTLPANKTLSPHDTKNSFSVTPGPMSYSAASAQGLNSSSAAASGSANKVSPLTNQKIENPAHLHVTSATPNTTSSSKNVTIDEWTTKYADFLSKQKTDLSPISLRPRGLTNRSNYCYINSILQALLGCSPFFNLIRSIPKQMVALSSVKTPTVNAMINFTSHFSTMPSGLRLRTNNRRSHKGAKDDMGAELQCDTAFEPTEIYKLWHESRKEEGEGRQEDAEEFLGYVLNKINDEMEEVIKLCAKPKPEQNGQSEQSESEDGDAWQMICNSRNRSSITRQNAYINTPLSDIFRGEFRSRLQREGEHSTDVIQPFYTLQLNIEKATSVKEALELLSGRDQLEGVTGSKSKQEVLAWQQMTIEKLPIVLILHLKYFDYRQDGLNKIIKQVDFPIELKIDPKIMATKKYSQRQRSYRLIAVVYHDGKEASKGHYIADVYHTGYSSWLRYDDNSVKPVSENHVLVPRAPRVPYLLYYRRCDTMPQTSNSNNNNNNNNSSHGGNNQSNGNNNAAGDRSRH